MEKIVHGKPVNKDQRAELMIKTWGP